MIQEYRIEVLQANIYRVYYVNAENMVEAIKISMETNKHMSYHVVEAKLIIND